VHGGDEIKTALAGSGDIVDEREAEEARIFGEFPAVIAGTFFGGEADPAAFVFDAEFLFAEAVDDAALPFIGAMSSGAAAVGVIDGESGSGFAL
jgi:hypothetical protein